MYSKLSIEYKKALRTEDNTGEKRRIFICHLKKKDTIVFEDHNQKGICIYDNHIAYFLVKPEYRDLCDEIIEDLLKQVLNIFPKTNGSFIKTYCKYQWYYDALCKFCKWDIKPLFMHDRFVKLHLNKFDL